jgi:hypothetical protein
MPTRFWDFRNQFRGFLSLAVRSTTPTADAVRSVPELLPPCTSPVMCCVCASQKTSKSSPRAVLIVGFPMRRIQSLTSRQRVHHVCSCLSNIFMPLDTRKWQPASSRVEVHSQSILLWNTARFMSKSFFAFMSIFNLGARGLWLSKNSLSLMQS